MTWSSMLSSLILSTSSTGLTFLIRYIICYPVVKTVKDKKRTAHARTRTEISHGVIVLIWTVSLI